MKNLSYWIECQPYLNKGGKELVEGLNREDAIGLSKEIYNDQTECAKAVIVKELWLPAKGIIQYLFDKYPDIKEEVESWFKRLEKKAEDDFYAETGERYL